MGKSLKDIAEALKVSKTTVSWVLSGRGDEQKDKFGYSEKIIDYAKQVKYRPNYLAKSLSSGKNENNRIGCSLHRRYFLCPSSYGG